MQKDDYISLTDIARFKDPKRTDYIIQNWLRNRNTIEFIGIWERLNNTDFKPIEFEGFRNELRRSENVRRKKNNEPISSVGAKMFVEKRNNEPISSVGAKMFVEKRNNEPISSVGAKMFVEKEQRTN